MQALVHGRGRERIVESRKVNVDERKKRTERTLRVATSNAENRIAEGFASREREEK